MVVNNQLLHLCAKPLFGGSCDILAAGRHHRALAGLGHPGTPAFGKKGTCPHSVKCEAPDQARAPAGALFSLLFFYFSLKHESTKTSLSTSYRCYGPTRLAAAGCYSPACGASPSPCGLGHPVTPLSQGKGSAPHRARVKALPKRRVSPTFQAPDQVRACCRPGDPSPPLALPSLPPVSPTGRGCMCNLIPKRRPNHEKTYNQNQPTPNLQETGTMTEEKKQPSHKAFAVENFTKDDKENPHGQKSASLGSTRTAKALTSTSSLCPFQAASCSGRTTRNPDLIMRAPGLITRRFS